jgi:hypothetical protein
MSSPKSAETTLETACETRPGRPEAAAAIWRWRASDLSGAPEVSAARLRITGLLQAAVGVAFGLASYLWWSPIVAGLALTLATVILLTALASPTGLYAAVQRLFLATGRVVGRGMTWVVMVPLFYLVFFPFGLLLRRGRRDQLKRFFDRDVPTYWERRPSPREGANERPY